MAKRAEAAKKKAGTRAKKADPAAEPFFRPFSKLGRKDKEKKGEAKPSATPARAAKPSARAPEPAADQAKRKPRAAQGPAPEPAPADADTFAVYMAGVRALPGEGAHRIPRTASRIEKATQASAPGDPDADARARMGSLVAEGIRFETSDDGERLEGRRIDVDPRELRRLRRAQYAIDGKLDLHGLGSDEARHAVEAFVKKRSQDGDRVVLVVHGKGSHSPRGNAVLRGEIAAWLSQGRSARYVAAFSTAPDDHGGTGAVLVLLAR